jgi:CheY-like chemotaxis protein
MTDYLIYSAAIAERPLQQGEESGRGTISAPSRPIKTILIVEDNEIDGFMTKRACQSIGIPHQLRIVTDGAMAIDYLFGNGCYADRSLYPVPDIIFLDLNMPKQNGFEVLKLIRAKPALKKLPVIMLSSSTLMADVDRAYQLGVTSYLQKVSSPAEFARAIEVGLKYWLHR